MRINATLTTTRKTWPMTAKTAIKTRRTSTKTRRTYTRIARICAATSADTNQKSGAKKAARENRVAFFVGRMICLDSDSAFEYFHSGPADARHEFPSALRDFHFEVAGAPHFRTL